MRGKSLAFLGGLGVGALVMYFLDPSAGARRRAEAQQKVLKTGRKTRQAIDETAKDLAQRAKDDVLAQRVRTSLTRVISHPRMINITAAAGAVTLSGTVSEEEAEALTATVREVPGVRDVVDETKVREETVRG